MLRSPAQIALYLGGINRITLIMARAIGDKADLFGIGPAIPARVALIEHGADAANDIDVALFGITADIIGLTRMARLNHAVQRPRMIIDMQPNIERMRASAADGLITATDLADWLTQVLNIPFRDAHHITGKIVKLAETKGVGLAALALADMQSVEPAITQDIFKVLTPEASAASRTSFGGTAPANVRAQIAAARTRFLRQGK